MRISMGTSMVLEQRRDGIEPIRWAPGDDLAPIWDRVERTGVATVRMPGAAELATSAPERLAELLLPHRPYATQVIDQRVERALTPGVRPYAITSDATPFHIEPHPFLPPALHLLACVRQARDPGGTCLFLDSWKVLDELAAENSRMLAQLFELQRVIQFHDFAWFGPTFSLRAESLVVAHNGFPRRADAIGARFHQLLHRQQPLRCKLEPGDVLICNNHRMLHARTAFSDTSRHLVQVLAWLDDALPAPNAYAARSTLVATATEENARYDPLWVRKRLGFSGLLPGHERYDRAELLAYYRGELTEDVGQQAQLLRTHAQLRTSVSLF